MFSLSYKPSFVFVHESIQNSKALFDARFFSVHAYYRVLKNLRLRFTYVLSFIPFSFFSSLSFSHILSGVPLRGLIMNTAVLSTIARQDRSAQRTRYVKLPLPPSRFGSAKQSFFFPFPPLPASGFAISSRGVRRERNLGNEVASQLRRNSRTFGRAFSSTWNRDTRNLDQRNFV